MNDEILPSRLYKAFLNQFVAEGLNKIPYKHVEIHKAFYNVLKEKHDLATQWKLQRVINPYCGKLDELIKFFNKWEITGIDNLMNPQNLVIVNMEKYNEQPSEAEIEIAHKIKEDYLKLVA